MTKKNQHVYEQLLEQHPDAKPELVFESRFQLIIAVILSAQCTDKRVNKVTKELFAVAPTAEALSKMPIAEIEELIKTCGLYKNKAKYIKQTATVLATEYEGDVPSDYEALLELAGVSRKTANVVLSVGFGIPAIAVDTHVFRVSRRIGIAKGTTVLAVEQALQKAYPKKYWSKLHHLLIFHGRYVCKARKPDCESCRVSGCCTSFRTGDFL